MPSPEIQSDPIVEAERVIDAARRRGISLSATGGVAVAICCPSARTSPLARQYGDLDYVTTAKEVREAGDLLVELGYEPDEQFNALNSESRVFFLDRINRREADVFVGAVRGCHELALADRLSGRTLAPADLLLSKLQVRQTNRKDYLDIFALLLDHDFTVDDSGINEARLTEVCGNDWGWWRTVVEVSERSDAFAAEILAEHTGQEHVRSGLAHVRQLIEAAPKSRRWKMRARVGERVKWYETPEELDH